MKHKFKLEVVCWNASSAERLSAQLWKMAGRTDRVFRDGRVVKVFTDFPDDFVVDLQGRMDKSEFELDKSLGSATLKRYEIKTISGTEMFSRETYDQVKSYRAIVEER